MSSYFISLFLAATLPILALTFEEIAQQNLKTFPACPYSAVDESFNFETYYEWFAWEFTRQRNPHPREQREHIFSLLSQYEKKILVRLALLSLMP